MKARTTNEKLPATLLHFQQDMPVIESIYQKMIEEIDDYAIFLLDVNGMIVNWNKGAEIIKGYKKEEIIGRDFRLFYTKEDQLNKLPDEILKEAIEKGKASHDGWRVRKNGSLFWGSVMITTIHNSNNGVIGFTKVTRDLTERKVMEDNMITDIVDTQEKERKLISDELHDNISQKLAASKLFIEMAMEECQSKYLAQGRQNLVEAADEIRNISYRLSPSIVTNLGLSEAINALVDNINQLNKVKTEFHYKIARLEINPVVQLALFRIIQEQMNNILKHAAATQVKIDLLKQAKLLSLMISDNGQGFDFNSVKKGLGLQNILYRAELCKGKAIFTSSAGNGCILRVDIPLTPDNVHNTA
jgi:PAS domain S-box-containing protein